MTESKAYKQLQKELETHHSNFSDGLISYIEYGLAICSTSNEYLFNLQDAYKQEQKRNAENLEQLAKIIGD